MCEHEAGVVSEEKPSKAIVTFALGQIVMTGGIADRVSQDEAFAKFVAESLERHKRCDWGDMCDEDKKANDRAIGPEGPQRTFSAYKHEVHPKIWIITEWDRSVTTILYPHEY